MKLSIVATLYQSAPYVEEFCRRASAAARQLVHNDYEIVLVDDGSPDNSLELAVRYHESDPHVIIVDLSRNFGHHRAMMTGLAHARGEHIFLIDSDLEEEPEWLASFSGQMARERCDVVYGVQEHRKGGMFERWSGQCYYNLFRAITGLAMPCNQTTARLMSRRYVNALMQFEEREMEIGALWYITGFVQSPQTVTKHSKGTSTYNLQRKVLVLVNSVTSFSNAPLAWIFYIGGSIFFIACIYVVYLIVRRLFDPTPIDGWTSLMVSVWLLGGLTLSAVGVVGIYLAKVFSETKRRPNTIIRRIYGK
jgi:putative glycosyltransferase